eukprot:TRINITY_DN560_c0_g1_i1.p1 TRINITY_DN560_c0_g1~~TRINITY_DN560_c0_g1_i1.p1  ORF type:complete len:277 (-),score=72.48 TRINITY_DN560_c0_g1_i1:670-1500(-)
MNMSTTTTLKFYWRTSSPSCQGPILFLLQNNISFQELKFDPQTLQNRTDDSYAKLNPNKTVPLLDDGGFIVMESHSILRYLVDRFTPDSYWYPKELRERSRIDQFLDWMYNNTRRSFQEVLSLFFSWPDPSKRPKIVQQQIEDLLFGSEADWAFQLISGFKSQFKLVQDYWLTKSPFLVSQHPTIADLAFWGDTKFIQIVFTNMDINSNFPVLKKWIDRMDSLFAHFPSSKSFIQTLETLSIQFNQGGFPKERTFRPVYDSDIRFDSNSHQPSMRK